MVHEKEVEFVEKVKKLQRVVTIGKFTIVDELLKRGYGFPAITPKELQKVTVPAGGTIEIYNYVPTGYTGYFYIIINPEVDFTVDVDIYVDGILVRGYREIDWRRALLQLANYPFEVDRYIRVVLANDKANDYSVYVHLEGSYIRDEYKDLLRLL